MIKPALTSTLLWALAVSPLFLTARPPGSGLPQKHRPKSVGPAVPIPGNLDQAVIAARHAMVPDGEGFRGYNPRNRLSAQFSAQAAFLRHPDGGAGLQWAGYGRPGNRRKPSPARLVAEGDRVEYQRGALTEWYLNRAEGLEQGFTLVQRPSGEGPIAVAATTFGELQPRLESSDSVRLEQRDEAVLHYAGLKSWDVSGRPLASRMEVRGSEIQLIVYDSSASYPITIDPIIQQEAKLIASDSTAYDHFGVSVALSGETAIIGALDDEDRTGAAYVFVKMGNTWTQQAKLTAPDSVPYYNFGQAVALSGDTAIVGTYSHTWP